MGGCAVGFNFEVLCDIFEIMGYILLHFGKITHKSFITSLTEYNYTTYFEIALTKNND